MLEQQGHDNSQEQPAAQVRVKSEELAQAIAAIEARRQEEARRLEGTILIGDVAQELQLDASPEEIWAEIQKQREQAPSQPSAIRTLRLEARHPELAARGGSEYAEVEHTGRQTRAIGNASQIIIGVTAILSLCLIGFTITLTSTPNPRPVPRPMTLPQSRTDASIDSVPDVESAPRGFVRLNDLRNQEIFSCPSYMAIPLLSGTQKYNPWIPQYPSPMRRMGFENWTFVKHDGRIYVRGWVAPSLRKMVNHVTPITIYSLPNAPELGGLATPITLAVGAFKYEVMYRLTGKQRIEGYDREDPAIQPGEPEMIRISDIILDEHAWEKWVPL